MKRFILYLLVSVLAACEQSSGGVAGAKGDTPVKYVICGAGESNCFVAARFKDIDACQRALRGTRISGVLTVKAAV